MTTALPLQAMEGYVIPAARVHDLSVPERRPSLLPVVAETDVACVGDDD